MPVVYIDVVWLINFAMDAVMLLVTGWIARRNLRVYRVLLGALVGSLYSLTLFFPPLTAFTTWPAKAVVSLVIVRLAVPARSWLDLARTTGLFYVVAVIFAGSAILIHFAVPGVSLTKGTVISDNKLMYVTSIESLALVVAIPLSIALLKYLMSRVKQLRVEKSTLCMIYATIQDRTIEFVGLLDTGNQLRDPITRRPVCLVDGSIMEKLLPADFQGICHEGANVFDVFQMESVENGTLKFSIIPYRGAGGQSEMTVAIRPDCVEYEVDGRRTKSQAACLFALHQRPLSIDGRFQAIVHIDVITGDDTLEDNIRSSQFEHETTYSPATPVDPSSS